MKVRCIETDHVNYSFSVGCDYDVDSFTDNSGNTFDVVHGDYIWFYFRLVWEYLTTPVIQCQ